MCSLLTMKPLQLVLVLFVQLVSVLGEQPPNIILIIADDLGWNDVGFHGSNEVKSPNIDALAYSGVILNHFYVAPMCTPTRASLLTGKYAVRTGLQSIVLFAAEPRGLPLEFKLLPQYLKDLGYATHLVGKWHLGMYKKEYTPTYRGFDSHLGYLSGHQDYYEHTAVESDPDQQANHSIQWYGFDMRRNMDFAYDLIGKFTTDIVTEESVRLIQEHNKTKPLFLQIAHAAPHAGNSWDPLRAPVDTVEKFSYIQDPRRRRLAAMIGGLDDSVGTIMDELDKSGLLDNSIVLFMSDNGGTTATYENTVGSNWPLRGEKATVWEGGVRSTACIWSPHLKNLGRISNQKIHVSDWLPTLYSAAGGNVNDLTDIDGYDLWETLKNDLPSPRNEILHNIDDIMDSAALTVGDWKIVKRGSMLSSQNGYYGDSGRNSHYSYDIGTVKNSDVAKVTATYRMKPFASSDVSSMRSKLSINCTQLTPTLECAPLPCLFNIKNDPCEQFDLALLNPIKLFELYSRLQQYRNITVEPSNQPWDIRGNPRYWNNTWTTFGDYISS